MINIAMVLVAICSGICLVGSVHMEKLISHIGAIGMPILLQLTLGEMEDASRIVPTTIEVRTANDASLRPNKQSEIHLSWDKPLWAKEPAVNGYLVQWKITGRNDYSASQQILIDDLDTTDSLILALKPGTAYTIRVAAVDVSDPGLLISRYGHKRYAETAITTPPLLTVLKSISAQHLSPRWYIIRWLVNL